MNRNGANRGAEAPLPAVEGLAVRFRKVQPAAKVQPTAKRGAQSGAKSVGRRGRPDEPKSPLPGIIILVAVGCLAITAFVRVLPKDPIATRKRAPVSMAMTDLETALASLRSAWRPADHARALAAMVDQAEVYAGPLRQLLREAEHPLIVPALELAGFLRLEAALPDVLRLANLPRSRIPALTAADAIAPFAEAELQALLDDSEPTMVIAALAMAQRRDDPPLRSMVTLLAHENDRIGAAALASLPPRLPEELRSDLDWLTNDARQAVRTRAWQALLRIGADVAAAQGGESSETQPEDEVREAAPAPSIPSDAHTALIARLDAGDDEAKIAALQELGALALPEDGERVAAMLQDEEQAAVKKEACLFLGRVQYRPAVREMIDLMRDTADAGLKANAHWSLQRITGLKLKQDADLWDQWWQRAGSGSVAASPPR